MSRSDQNLRNGACMNFQPLGFYFINSPLRPFFRDFQIGPQAQILPSCHYPLTHRKKLAKRQYTTVRGFRKCLWGIPGVAGLARNPDTNSMVLLFWDGGSIILSNSYQFMARIGDTSFSKIQSNQAEILTPNLN